MDSADEGVPSSSQINKEDAALIEELLLAQVPLERTIELFRGRVDDIDIYRIAQKLVTDKDKNKNSQNYVSLTNYLEEEVPEDFMDPIFMNIMNDPVVLSSGFVVDRDTVMDKDTGRMKFHTCPFTRERLKEDVYPLVFLKKKLVQYKEQKIQPMLGAAAHLVENNRLHEFIKVQAAIKDFVSSLGEATYARYEREVAELNLKAWGKAGHVATKLWTPEMLADNFIRIHKTMPEIWGNDVSEGTAKKRLEFLDRISVLEQRAIEAIADNDLDQASAWCDACELVNESCKPLSKFAVHKMRLSIGKKRGDDLGGLRARVYLEIQNDAAALQKFFQEEGLDPDAFKCFAHLPIAIRVKFGMYIDSCTFAYPTGRVVNYGGSGGVYDALIVIKEGEMVVAVEGFQYNEPRGLGSFLKFTTTLTRDGGLICVVGPDDYNESEEGGPEYPDPNFSVPDGQETYPHPTLDGFYYRFRCDEGIFGLKTTHINCSNEMITGVDIISGIINGEDHLELEKQLCLSDGEYRIGNANRGALLCVNTGACFEALVSADPDYENEREERWHLRGQLDGTYFICNDTHGGPLVCNEEAFEQNDRSYWALVSTTPVTVSTSLEALFYRSRGLWSIRREIDGSCTVQCDGSPLFCSDYSTKEGHYRAKIHMDPTYEDDGKERWMFELISPLPQRTRSEVIASLFHGSLREDSSAETDRDEDSSEPDWDEDNSVLSSGMIATLWE
jgi:hypothetical protein